MGRPKKFNRDEVLAKAIPLFWERGYADTGLQEIEAATGVNKSGLYSEFKDKEDIFLSSLKHYIENRKTKEVLLSEPFGWDNIERYLKASLVCPEGQKGCFSVSSMREFALLPPQALEMITENRSRMKKLVMKNISAEQTKLSADAIADVFFTFSSGLSIEQNLKINKATLLRKIEDFMKALRSL